jgi:hypothetical protein
MLAMCLTWLVWHALAGVLLGPEPTPAPSWRSPARRPSLRVGGALWVIVLATWLLAGAAALDVAILVVTPISLAIASFLEARVRRRAAA